jgi:hypothetical protein
MYEKENYKYGFLGLGFKFIVSRLTDKNVKCITKHNKKSKFVSKLMKEKNDGKRKNLLRNNEFNYSGTMVRDIKLWS